MRRSGVRGWVMGLGALVLGCDLEQIGGGVGQKVEEVAAPLPSVAAPPAASSSASPPAIAPFAAASAAPAPSAVAETPVPILGLSAGAALAGLFVNQLRVVPASAQPTKDRFATTAAPPSPPLRHEVTLYVVFKAPFARRLELRALDEHSAEIGRSEREVPITQSADSSRYVTFRFDPRLPIERVRTFVAYVDPAPEALVEEAPAPAASSKPAVKQTSPPEPPAPPPEPQPLDSPRPGLVPKDP